MRWLGIAAGLLVGLLIVGALALQQAASNPRASAWLAQQAALLAPGELSLDGIDGDLVSGLHVARLDYQLPVVHLQITDLTVSLAWPAVIQRRLVLPMASADEVSIELLPAAADEDDGELPAVDLPFEIRASDIRINTLRFVTDSIDETLTDLAGRVTFNGPRLDVEHLQARRVQAGARLTGAIRFVDRYPLEARIEWRDTSIGVSGQGTVRGDLDRLTLAQALRVPDEIGVTGELVDLLDNPALSATARWNSLDLARITDGLRTDAGQLELSGWLDGYIANISTPITLPEQPRAQLTAAGQGDLQQFTLDESVISILNGTIEGTGQFRFASGDIALNLRAAELDPALLYADFPGRLGGRVQITGTVPERVIVRVERIDGELLGRAVSGTASIDVRPNALTISGLRAAVAENRVEFDGTLTPSLTGRFLIDAPNLAAAWPDAAGRLEGTGDISGTLASPEGNVVLSASGLSLGDRHVDAAEVRARIDDRQQTEIRVFASGLREGKTSIGDLGASLVGTLKDHEFSANLTGGFIDVALRSRGSWDGDALNHRLESGAIDAQAAGVWRLAAPFAIRAGTEALRMDAHCWQQVEGGGLCVDESWLEAGSLSVSGRLTALPLAIAQPWLPDTLSVSGSADAIFNLRQDDTGLAAALDWSQQDTTLVYGPPGDDPLTTRFDEVTLSARADATRTRINARLRSDLGIAADLDISAPTPPDDSGPLDGRLIVDAPDVGTAAALVARFVDIRDLRGRLTANLSLGGSPAEPRVRGEVRLADGFAQLPQTGIEISDIDIALRGNDAAPLQLTGTARSGDGEIKANGTAQFSRADGFVYDIRVTGDRFEAVRLPGQTVLMSPDVRARASLDELRIDGSILIPEADIVVDTLPESAVTPSADAVVVGEDIETVEQAPALQFVGELEVRLGEDVHFAGFGLDTQLAGGLKLARTRDSVGMVTEGNLRTVEGRFEAYGKKLTIDRGTLIFNGPIDNPNVDVRASRKLTYEGEPIVVGVLLSGPITAIRTTLFSEPSMSEADALSYLILNRPIQQAGDSADLSSAAIALGISQALPVTQELQESLGLDEVSLEGTEDDSTALIAGKRLSEDLYLRFSYGLFNRIGTFIIRYELGRGFSIEAGSGEEQTLDLIYSIRR